MEANVTIGQGYTAGYTVPPGALKLPLCHFRAAGQRWTFLLVSVLTCCLWVGFSLSIYLELSIAFYNFI